MSLSRMIMRLAGWRVNVAIPRLEQCIVCVAPHTSNWDFVIGRLAWAAARRGRVSFLMKSTWFFPPLGWILKAMGGVPVYRGGGAPSLVEALTERFRRGRPLTLAITPEGTRSRTVRWHTGFLRVALQADVPVALAVMDYGHKQVTVDSLFEPTGDIEADMARIKDFYRGATGRYPEKFTTD